MRAKTFAMLISILLIAAFASGQVGPSLKVKIPFAFSVEKSVLPAGEYEFTESSNINVPTIAVRSSDGKTSVIAFILTRMASGIHTSAQDSHIVFDKAGDSYTLSEIWMPGQDGFMLSATKTKHEHRIINVAK